MTAEIKLDLSYLDSIAGGDQSFIKEMMEMFLRSTPAEMVRIEDFFKSGDLTMMSSAAHKIKAPVQMLGEKRTADLVLEIERIGKQNAGTDKLPELVDELRNRLVKLYEVVQQHINGLQL